MTQVTLSATGFKYNQNGSGYRDPHSTGISVGTSGQPGSFVPYRGYFQISLASIPAAAIINSVTLNFYRNENYSTKYWDIGLKNSAPPVTFTQDNFSQTIANDMPTTKGSNSVSISASNISSYIGGTVYVWFCGRNSYENNYGEIATSGANAPTLIVDYTFGKSTMSVSNGNFGESQSISVTRQDSSFTHTLVSSCAGVSNTIVTKSSSTSLSWTPAIATYAPHITNATSATCTYTLTTYYGNTVVGTDTKSVTLTLPSANITPTVSLSVSDGAGYASVFGAYIVGRSTLSVSVSPSLKYGATLSSVSTTANGASYSQTSFTTSVIRSGQTSISTTIRDTRGKSASATQTVQLLEYAPPNLSVNVQRCDSDGTANSSGEYCKVTSTYSITSLSNNNTKSMVLKHKKASDASYTSVTRTVPSYSGTDSYIFAADTDSSYNVQVILSDYFTSTTVSRTLSTAAVTFDLYADGTGMSFGKVAESGNLMDIAWPVTMRNTDLSINDSSGTRRVLARADNGGNSNITLYDANGQYRVLMEDEHINLYQSDGSWVTQIRTDGTASGHPLPVNQGGTGMTTSCKEISQAPTDTGVQSWDFTITTAFTIGSVTFPRYAKGHFICNGNDAVMYATGGDGYTRTAFRNGATWGNAVTNEHTTITGDATLTLKDITTSTPVNISGASYTLKKVYQTGNVVYVQLQLNCSSNLTAGNYYSLGGISGVTFPHDSIRTMQACGQEFWQLYEPFYALIGTSGGIEFRPKTAQRRFSFNFCYVV